MSMYIITLQLKCEGFDTSGEKRSAYVPSGGRPRWPVDSAWGKSALGTYNNILWAWPLVLNRFLNNCNYTMVYTWNYLLLQRNRRDYHQEDEEKKINKPSERCHFQFHNRSSLCFQHVYGIVFDNEIIEMIGCMCVRVRVRAAGSTGIGQFCDY